MTSGSLAKIVSDRDVINTAKGDVVREELLRHMYEAAQIRQSVKNVLEKEEGTTITSTDDFLRQRSFEDNLTKKQATYHTQTLDEFLLSIDEGTVVELSYHAGEQKPQVFARSRVSRHIPGSEGSSLGKQIQLSPQRYEELFEFLAASEEIVRRKSGLRTVIGFRHMTGKEVVIAIEDSPVDEAEDFVSYFDTELEEHKKSLERSRMHYEILLRTAYTPDRKLRLGTIREVLETVRTTGVHVSKTLLKEVYGKSLGEPMDAFFRLMASISKGKNHTGRIWEHIKITVQRIFGGFPQLVQPLLKQVAQVFFPRPRKLEKPSVEAQLWAEQMAKREPEKETNTSMQRSKTYFRPVTEQRSVRPSLEVKEQGKKEIYNTPAANNIVFIKRATEAFDPTLVRLSQKEIVERKGARVQQHVASPQQERVAKEPIFIKRATEETLDKSMLGLSYDQLKLRRAEKDQISVVPAAKEISSVATSPVEARAVWPAPQEEFLGVLPGVIGEAVKRGVNTVQKLGGSIGKFAKKMFSRSAK